MWRLGETAGRRRRREGIAEGGASGGEVSENSASSGGGLYINHATASGEDVDFIDNDPDDVYKARTSTSYTLGTGADFSY